MLKEASCATSAAKQEDGQDEQDDDHKQDADAYVHRRAAR
jgi:hypothetical protein